MSGAMLRDLKILVVGGTRPMSALVDGMLRSLGIGQVREARDAAEAVVAMRREAADVVICATPDWHREENWPDVPTIMLLRSAGPAERQAAKAAGATALLSHPITAKTLFQRLVAATRRD